MDIEHLIELTNKVRSGTASKQEKDVWMRMLYDEGRISYAQYQNYLKGGNTDDIVQAALAIVAIFLFTYLLAQLFKK